MHPQSQAVANQDQTEVDMVIPIQNKFDFMRADMSYMSLPYSTLDRIRKIVYIAPKKKRKPADIMSSLFRSLFQTWPLLIIAFSMAFGAGSVVWVLVSIGIVLGFSLHGY